MAQPCDGHVQTSGTLEFSITHFLHVAELQQMWGTDTEGDMKLKKTVYAYRSKALASSNGSHAA